MTRLILADFLLSRLCGTYRNPPKNWDTAVPGFDINKVY
jgi:hypothetical protein